MNMKRGNLLLTATFAFVGLPSGVLGQVGDLVGCAHQVQTMKDASNQRDDCKKLALTPVNVEEETALGGAVAVRMVGAAGLVIDDPSAVDSPKLKIARYVDIVGRNLAAQSARPTLSWTFAILDEPTFNAYSAPGGYVFVSKTLLKRVDNEAQLAAVLAHEIAHVTERQAIHAYQALKAKVCDTEFGGTVAGGVAGPLANNLLGSMSSGFLNLNDVKNFGLLDNFSEGIASALTNGFPEADEYAADRIGAELLISAGYNPNEMAAYLRRLPAGSPLLRNHPSPQSRRERLEAWMKGRYQPTNAGSDDLLASDWPFDGYPSVRLPADIKAIISAL